MFIKNYSIDLKLNKKEIKINMKIYLYVANHRHVMK